MAWENLPNHTIQIGDFSCMGQEIKRTKPHRTKRYEEILIDGGPSVTYELGEDLREWTFTSYLRGDVIEIDEMIRNLKTGRQRFVSTHTGDAFDCLVSTEDALQDGYPNLLVVNFTIKEVD